MVRIEELKSYQIQNTRVYRIIKALASTPRLKSVYKAQDDCDLVMVLHVTQAVQEIEALLSDKTQEEYIDEDLDFLAEIQDVLRDGLKNDIFSITVIPASGDIFTNG